MERISKVLVILGIVVVMGLAVATEVEGGRILKSNENVDHPENFVGGIAGVFPTPTGTSVGYCTFPGGCSPSMPLITNPSPPVLPAPSPPVLPAPAPPVLPVPAAAASFP